MQIPMEINAYIILVEKLCEQKAHFC